MDEKKQHSRRDIAATSRNDLANLKGQLADALLSDDPTVLLSDVLETNSLIDQELDSRADEGDITYGKANTRPSREVVSCPVASPDAFDFRGLGTHGSTAQPYRSNRINL